LSSIGQNGTSTVGLALLRPFILSFYCAIQLIHLQQITGSSADERLHGGSRVALDSDGPFDVTFGLWCSGSRDIWYSIVLHFKTCASDITMIYGDYLFESGCMLYG